MAGAVEENSSSLQQAEKQILLAQADGSALPVIEAFFDKFSSTVSYVVSDPKAGEAAIIDPVLDYDPSSGRTSHTSADTLIDYITCNNLQLKWLLETHAHADHLSSAPYIQEKLGGEIAIGEHITAVQRVFGDLFNAGDDFRRDGSDFDRLLADGDRLNIGNLDVTVLHVPGHTPACIAYVIGDAVFVGDTMFMPDYGTARADFPGGDARTLYRSLRRILSLPGDTRLFMCHDYLPETRNTYAWESTVSAQRKDNVHAHDGIGEDAFVEMRERRDSTLAMPALILPSVQVNMRGGHMPPAEENGVTYLKIPVNAV